MKVGTPSWKDLLLNLNLSIEVNANQLPIIAYKTSSYTFTTYLNKVKS